MILRKETFLEKKLKDPHVLILGDNQIVLKDLKSIYGHRVGLIYIDPPYKGTKQYAKNQIDYDEFYDFCRKLSQNNIVLISEYEMPNDFKCIWEKERKVMQKSDRIKAMRATERLFILN